MSKQLVVLTLMCFFALSGCVTDGTHFFDSAMNDHNRAPASLKVPKAYEGDYPTVDALHNQAEADYLFLQADLKSQEGQSAEALDLYKSILVYDPDSATVKQKIAVEYYRQGQIRDALYWAEKAKAQAPKQKDINMLLGGLYSATKNYPKALAIYQDILKNNPDDSDTHLYISAIYSEQKNYKKSIEHLTILSKDQDSNSRHLAHYYLARIYLDQGLKGQYSKVEYHLKKSLEIKPDFFDGVLLLGKLYEKTKDKKKAYEFYADYQKKKGPLPKLAELLSQYYIEKNNYDKAYEQLEILEANYEDQPQVKLKMALILIDKKMYDVASKKLIEVLTATPDSDKVRFYLSAVYEELKQFKKSYEQYMQIGKDSSYFEESRLHAAFLSKKMGNTTQGIDILKEVVKGKVTNPQVYLLMAQLYEEEKDLNKALVTMEKATDLFPDIPELYFYQGLLQEKNNDRTKMTKSMEQVLKLDPNHTQAMNYLAYSWAEDGVKLEEAEKFARMAVDLEKNDGFILDTLGWVLYKKGQYKEAQSILEKAYKIQPKASIIAEHLGEVYIKNQSFDKARNLFLKAAELEISQNRKKEISSKINFVEDLMNGQKARAPASSMEDGK